MADPLSPAAAVGWLPLVGAAINVALGLNGLLRPAATAEFTSMSPVGRIGVSEIRATYGGLFLALGAFALATGSKDSALLITLPTGSYTAQITGPGTTTGIALAEIYDAQPKQTAYRLMNASARAQVGVGGSILIAGFTLSGNLPTKILIRGIGPSL